MYRTTLIALACTLLYSAASASPVVPGSIIPAITSERHSEPLSIEERSKHMWIDEFDNIHTVSGNTPVAPEQKSRWSRLSGSAYLASLQRQPTTGGDSANHAHFRDFVSRRYSNGVGFDHAYVQGFFYGLVGVSLFCLAVSFFYAASRYLFPSSVVQSVSRRRTGHRRGQSRWSL